MAETTRVAMLGAGMISAQYLKTLTALPDTEVVICADLLADRAQAAAEPIGARALTPDEALEADDVDVVLNLTLPAVHADVSLRALAAGKHVYSEKPLAATSADARRVLASSADLDLRVGCAPDTVLGTGVQTARAVIDEGSIGVPVAAMASFMGRGPEHGLHPRPGVFFQRGAGPLFDMGPYYLSALVTLLGPVAHVVAAARTPTTVRTVTSGPAIGSRLAVEVDTHVSATIEHDSGVLSTIVVSFDIRGGSRLPRLEVYGTEGTVSVGDPNRFHDPVEIASVEREWSAVQPRAGYIGAGRGIGLADLSRRMRHGLPHRASAELGVHVLDVMETIERSASQGKRLSVETTCARPDPVSLSGMESNQSR